MRVLVATTAGAGHFAPLVPFAVACVAAGHEVRVAAPESFRDTVERAGLEVAPLDDAAPEALGMAMGRIPELTMREANELVVREVFGRIDAESALPGMRAIFETWPPDVVLRESAELASFVLASQQGVPSVEVNPGLDSFVDDLVTLLDEERPDLLALSVTMEFNLPSLRTTVEKVRVATKGALPIAIGGGAGTSGIADELGADATGSDASETVAAALRLLGVAAA